MTRNAEDYSAAVLCFARVRTAQFALELMYSWDRAAAIAFSRVAEGHRQEDRLSDERMKNLSKRLKVYLTLKGLHGFGGAQSEDGEEFDAGWAGHTPSLKTLLRGDVSLLEGPSTGRCDPLRLKELEAWFAQVAAETEETAKSPAKK